MPLIRDRSPPHKSPANTNKSIGAPGFEPGTSPTRTVRATRLRHAPNGSSIPQRRQPPSRGGAVAGPARRPAGSVAGYGGPGHPAPSASRVRVSGPGLAAVPPRPPAPPPPIGSEPALI